MIYEFKSRATGTVMMTEEVGARILKAIGKEPDPTGIITLEQIPAAIASLQTLHAHEPPGPAGGGREMGTDIGADGDEDDDENNDPVSLSKHAWPFIKMLEEALAGGKPVTWGV